MVRRFVPLFCVVIATLPARAPGGERATVRDAEPREDHPAGHSFSGPLPFFYDLYTFRGRADSTTVVAAFAVPAGRLERQERGDGVHYRFDVTLVLADTALQYVNRSDDSAFVGVPRPLAGEHLLYTNIEVQAPPSGSTLQRVILSDAMTPGVGQLYVSSFPIPDYSGSRLMLSDIALGQPNAAGGWRRGGVTLALLPTSQFPGSAFDVYYEIYNLPTGNRYVTEIAVEPAGETGAAPGSEPRPVRVRFTGESATRADGSLPELRRVETSLANGRYRITVTVTDEVTRQSVSRYRLFEVRGWKRGATLVPARPHGRREVSAHTR